MQYVEQQLSEFKADFAKRRKRQILGLIPVFAIFLLAIVLDKKPETALFDVPSEDVLGAAFVVVAGFVAFTLWNWRCPACHRYLGKGTSPAFCSKCGVPLR